MSATPDTSGTLGRPPDQRPDLDDRHWFVKGNVPIDRCLHCGGSITETQHLDIVEL